MKTNQEDLVFAYYKEPLKEIPKGEGFGYYGALLQNKEGTKIQCHICGDLFPMIGNHLKMHETNAKEYRTEFELAKTTALVSDVTREKMRIGYVNWVSRMSPKEHRIYIERMRNNAKALDNHRDGFKAGIRLETRNKRGTCPAQLLQKIVDVAFELERTPTKREFMDVVGGGKYMTPILKTYGTWSNAVALTGLAKAERKPEFRLQRRYSDEDLLEYLRNFSETNRRVPMTTDFRRGILPLAKTYYERFGNIENARKLAGCYNYQTSTKGQHVPKQ